MIMSTRVLGLFGVLSVCVLSGCAGTMPSMGDSGSKTVATGSTGGSSSSNANTALEKCDRSLGTLALVEDQNAPWYYTLRQYKLESTIPVLRMIVQQSNCFVVIERGSAMNNMMQERALAQSGEMRTNSNMGKGQMVAADYTMKPTITFSQKGTGGLGGAASSFGGMWGGVASAVAGGLKTNEASTMLLMIDNRSGVQLAAAEGSAKNMDFNFAGGLFGGYGGAGLGGYTSTPEGKIIVAAFMDSYNQLVKAVRNYKAQTVEGGLGTGGTLGVSGGSTPAGRAVDNAGQPSRGTRKSRSQ